MAPRDDPDIMMSTPALIDPVRRRMVATAAAVLGAAALTMLAPTAGPSLDGELRIVGSRSMRQPVEGWLEILRRRHPEVRASTALYGSGLAAGGLADDSIDVAPLSRKLVSSERAMIPDGYQPVAIRVGARREFGDSSATPVYLYIALGADRRPEPAAVEFARIAVSAEGQSLIASDGFEELSAEQRDDARAYIARLLTNKKQGEE